MSWARGRTVIIEARANLLQGTWTPVDTNTFPAGSSYFSEPVGGPARYYRLRGN